MHVTCMWPWGHVQGWVELAWLRRPGCSFPAGWPAHGGGRAGSLPSFLTAVALHFSFLQVGQPMVVGTEWGRVRALRGTGGRSVEEVLPGQPAEIAGLKGLPQAGDQVLVSRVVAQVGVGSAAVLG